MTIRGGFLGAIVALAIAASAGTAGAVGVVNFELTGVDDNLNFSVAEGQLPALSVPGNQSVYVTNFSGTLSGQSLGGVQPVNTYFLNTVQNGGNDLLFNVTTGPAWGTNEILTGAQLYTGSEASPVFLPGTYTVVDGNGNNETLTINVVPLPGALSLFGTAIIGIAALARRRRSA